MKKINIVILLSVAITVLLLSCKSVPQKDNCIVYLMVYDYGNNAIKDVNVIVDDKNMGKTDVYGRFIMQLDKDEENHVIRIQKEGYESVSVTEEMENQKVFYFKIGDSLYYAELAEKYYDQKEYEKAENAINIALSITERKDYLFLKKVITEGKR